MTERSKLSATAADIIGEPSVIKHVSAISFFEMSIKISIGKLHLAGVQYGELPAILYDRGIELIVFEPFEAVALHKLPPKENHSDPFDRMLISQAIERNLTLISSDEKIAQYREHGLSLLW
jgi:PIN domain nuclease of toxin-antitoxin system